MTALPIIPQTVDTPKCPRIGDRTPWGHAQSVEMVPGLPGARWVSTASHGGIWLAPGLLAIMPEVFRRPSRFYPLQDGPQWFEEDCEVCRVVLSFPSAFQDCQCMPDAIETARMTWKFLAESFV